MDFYVVFEDDTVLVRRTILCSSSQSLCYISLCMLDSKQKAYFWQPSNNKARNSNTVPCTRAGNSAYKDEHDTLFSAPFHWFVFPNEILVVSSEKKDNRINSRNRLSSYFISAENTQILVLFILRNNGSATGHCGKSTFAEHDLKYNRIDS